MFRITSDHLCASLQQDNPWWQGEADLSAVPTAERSATFPLLSKLTKADAKNRGVLLTGGRGTGKSVVLKQVISRLIKGGVPGQRLVYINNLNPLYTRVELLDLIKHVRQINKLSDETQIFLLLDDVHQRDGWADDLIVLARRLKGGRLIAASSLLPHKAVVGLNHLHLPTLTFPEYLQLSGKEQDLVDVEMTLGSDEISYGWRDIHALNRAFFDYLNGVDWPLGAGTISLETLLPQHLSNLEGVGNPQEMDRILATLALNTGMDTGVEAISLTSSVAKNTVRKYLDFLERAMVIRRVYRTNRKGERFQREKVMRVMLSNMALRERLFGPMALDEPLSREAVTTGIFAQIAGELKPALYGAWGDGKADMVELEGKRPVRAVQVVWSDKDVDYDKSLLALASFARGSGAKELYLLTRSRTGHADVDGFRVSLLPAAVYGYLATAGVVLV